MDEVDGIVSGWTRGIAKEPLFTGLAEAGVPCAPVRELTEVQTDPQRALRLQVDALCNAKVLLSAAVVAH